MKISLRALTFAYRFTPGGSATLNNLDLEFDSAEAIGLLGQVGSGKSTLLKILAGAITAGKGMMFVDDEPFTPAAYVNTATGERPWWCRMAYVAQRPEDQLVGRTVEQEIAYGLRNLRNQEEQSRQYNDRRDWLEEMRAGGFRLSALRRRSEERATQESERRARKEVQRTEIAARVSNVLRGAGLEPDVFRTRGLDELSRGEKRRVALAAALALDPDMLLLDESLSNIDPAGHDSLIATIQHARTATHCGMVASSHRIEDILPFVERIIFLTGGGIAWDGPTGRFLEAWAAAWNDPGAPHADLFATLNVPPLLETLFRLRAGGLDVPLSAAIVTAPELAAQVVAEAMARQEFSPHPRPFPQRTEGRESGSSYPLPPSADRTEGRKSGSSYPIPPPADRTEERESKAQETGENVKVPRSYPPPSSAGEGLGVGASHGDNN